MEVVAIALTVAEEIQPAYICPVCGEPVAEEEPDHPHLTDYLDRTSG